MITPQASSCFTITLRVLPNRLERGLLFTRTLVAAGKVLGVEVLDHLILGANRFISLKQRGAM
jgi:DNA repair protein RadC